ncbi:hypothetical protein MICRO11B_160060 [Micrococcus luteus]|nr:hypothetical protein MICRO11B_160060 [Micrococcus luteus]
MRRLPRARKIVYDLDHDAEHTGAHAHRHRARLHRPGEPAGQGARRPPELPLPHRPAGPAPAGPRLLPQGRHLPRPQRRHDRAPRRHRAARLRG